MHRGEDRVSAQRALTCKCAEKLQVRSKWAPPKVLPAGLEPATYGYSVVVVLIAAICSSWIVLRRVADLDLVAVLKTRE